MIIFPDFEENLEIEDGKCLTGMRQYVVTFRDKSNITKDEFRSKSYITINEMNHILSSHNAIVKSFLPVYKTGTEAFVHVYFKDDPSVTPKEPLPIQEIPEPESFEKKIRRYMEGFKKPEDDLTIEDGKTLKGARIYYVTSYKKNNLTKEYFFKYGCFSEKEYFHIRENHKSTAEEMFTVHNEVPCYFAVLNFED